MIKHKTSSIILNTDIICNHRDTFNKMTNLVVFETIKVVLETIAVIFETIKIVFETISVVFETIA